MAEYPVAETKPAVKPEQKKEDTKKSAKTADTSNPILYTGLMGLMIAAAVVLKKKQA